MCREGPLAGESWRASGGVGSASSTEGVGVARAAGGAPRVPTERLARPSAGEREAWTILASIPGLGPVTLGALLRRFGSAVAVLDAARMADGIERLAHRSQPIESDEADMRDGEGLVSADLAGRIVAAALEADELLERVRRLGLTVVTLEDQAYPGRLRAVEMPPHVLFVRGDVSALDLPRAVAVVGTRRPSDLGRRIAARIAAAIARTGAGVISGLAIGVDGAAHAAVAAERRATVAVLGGGHDRLYPQAHARLAEVIVAEGGAVVSELPPDAVPTRGTFPRRNRLISGLSDATVVVEAGPKSGALITAGWALEQGRECFLVPGPIDAWTSAGCLGFLRAYGGQARVVAGVPELIEDLGLVDPGPSRPSGATGGPSAAAVLVELGDSERSIARELLAGRATADELVAATGMSVGAVLGTLTLLEMRGLVTAAYGRYRPTGVLASASPPQRPSSARRR